MHYHDLSDGVILARSAEALGPALTARLAALARSLGQQAAVRDCVVGYGEVAVFYDPARSSYAACRAVIDQGWSAVAGVSADQGTEHRIPVRYDGADLDAVAAHAGLSAAAVVERHAAACYQVAAIGFTPDFPYLHGLDPALAMPRRTSPRLRVPAGSVAIGAAQSGIYPQVSPGGWHLIGSCDPTCCRRLEVGDRVRFEVVS
ncbi:MAG: 5-oxoprolinase subunit B family protein [Planctomycetota bacterium]|jgi:KipI family sensor histidine kinase inhibitor